ncbi:hypothetical protein J3459_012207 [Metarhizium acridum]|nr:hypothetical protein J3459_012207 [Metarhizium acridum]
MPSANIPWSPPRDVRQSPCRTKGRKCTSYFVLRARLLAMSDVRASRPIVNFRNSGHPPEPFVDVRVASMAICWLCLRFASVYICTLPDRLSCPRLFVPGGSLFQSASSFLVVPPALRTKCSSTST